jgi:hypothetical protein
LRHQPEPLKCCLCGKPQFTGPMASGILFLDKCEESDNGWHQYSMTLKSAEQLVTEDAARLADFARSHEKAVLEHAAEIADGQRENVDSSHWRSACNHCARKIREEAKR